GENAGQGGRDGHCDHCNRDNDSAARQPAPGEIGEAQRRQVLHPNRVGLRQQLHHVAFAHSVPPSTECPAECSSFASCSARRLRERWSRIEAAFSEQSSATASSVRLSASQAARRRISWSFGRSSRNAATTSTSSPPSSVCTAGRARSRNRSAASRRSERRWFASTRAAIAYSHASRSSSSGAWANRRQATANVPATTSSASARCSHRRSAYASTCRLCSVKRRRKSSSWSRPERGTPLTLNLCPARTEAFREPCAAGRRAAAPAGPGVPAPPCGGG